MTAIRSSLFITALLLISACGQKGPLYLPGNPSEIRTEVPATDQAPAPQETENDDEDPDEQR